MLETLFASAVCSLGLSLSEALPTSAPDIRWNGATISADDLPDELDDTVRSTLDGWSGWCARKEYTIDVSTDGRVLFLAPKERPATENDMQLIARTTAAFDELMPAPEREPVPDTEFESPFPDPDAEPVVLVRVDDDSDFRSLLDHISELKPALGAWSEAARRATGFLNTPVQAGAWIETPAGIEIGDVWRSDNELVNRLTQLLMCRRFGEQPYWLRNGVAWTIEQRVMDSIYSFPGRFEFIGIGEHSGWENELKRWFKKRKKDPLRFEELANWERGEWDARAAQLSWGLLAYLVKFNPDALSPLAEDLRVHYRQNALITHDDGRWELVAGYEVPHDVQESLVLEHLGEDILEIATEFFTKGAKRYKPKKKKG